MASDDTVLRLGTTDDMAMLDAFLHDPIARNASRLISIPALYQVLKSEVSKEGTYPKPILDVMGWIRNRARSVLEVLLSRGADLGVVSDIGGGDWKQVGAFIFLRLLLLKHKRLAHVTVYLKYATARYTPS